MTLVNTVALQHMQFALEGGTIAGVTGVDADLVAGRHPAVLDGIPHTTRAASSVVSTGACRSCLCVCVCVCVCVCYWGELAVFAFTSYVLSCVRRRLTQVFSWLCACVRACVVCMRMPSTQGDPTCCWRLLQATRPPFPTHHPAATPPLQLPPPPASPPPPPLPPTPPLTPPPAHPLPQGTPPVTTRAPAIVDGAA